jgi:hypothetical protein
VRTRPRRGRDLLDRIRISHLLVIVRRGLAVDLPARATAVRLGSGPYSCAIRPSPSPLRSGTECQSLDRRQRRAEAAPSPARSPLVAFPQPGDREECVPQPRGAGNAHQRQHRPFVDGV